MCMGDVVEGGTTRAQDFIYSLSLLLIVLIISVVSAFISSRFVEGALV